MENARNKQFVSVTPCAGQSSTMTPCSVPLGTATVPSSCPRCTHRATGFSERESKFITVCCCGCPILFFLLIPSCLIYKPNYQRDVCGGKSRYRVWYHCSFGIHGPWPRGAQGRREGRKEVTGHVSGSWSSWWRLPRTAASADGVAS